MTRLLTTTALCMGLSLGLAYAQQSTTPATPDTQTPSATKPPPATTTTPSTTTTSPSATTTTPPASSTTTTTTTTPPASSTTTAAPKSDTMTPKSGTMTQLSSDAFMQMQSKDQMSGDEMIGATVWGANNERIGEVNDLLLDNGGKVMAVVVGVGGFLGIGEKDVAVKFEQLDMMTEDDGDIRLTLNATKDQLKAAPDFAYLKEQNRGTTGAVRTPATGATPTTPANPANPPAGGTTTAPKQ